MANHGEVRGDWEQIFNAGRAVEEGEGMTRSDLGTATKAFNDEVRRELAEQG